jgi:hypothetical protein
MYNILGPVGPWPRHTGLTSDSRYPRNSMVTGPIGILGPKGAWARQAKAGEPLYGMTSDDMLGGPHHGGGGHHGGGRGYGFGYYEPIYYPTYTIPADYDSQKLTSDEVLDGYLGNLDIVGGDSAGPTWDMADPYTLPGQPLKVVNGTPVQIGDGQGWNHTGSNSISRFQNKRGRAPTVAEKAYLARLSRLMLKARQNGDERNFELYWRMVDYYIANSVIPAGKALAQMNAISSEVLRLHKIAYGKAHPSGILHSISSAVSTVTHAAASVYDDAAKVVKKVPFIGAPIAAVLNIANQPFKMAEAISKGANIKRLALSQLKDDLTNATTVAQTAAMVTSAIPGLGTTIGGIDSALAAASAIAAGKPITAALEQAVKDAALKAIPGGAVVQKAASEAFEVGKALAHGTRLDKIALERTRANLPAVARAALDAGLAIGQGKHLQDVLVKGVANLAVSKLEAEGAKVLAVSAPLRQQALALTGPARQGFHVASAILARKGVPPLALAALRQKLPAAQQAGYDQAVKAHAMLFNAFRSV